jgi:ComF family protein
MCKLDYSGKHQTMAILSSRDVKITSLLERIISFIAPHWCIVCSAEDNVLCEPCRQDAFMPLDPACAICGKPTVDWCVCTQCARSSGLGFIYVAAEYKGVPAELLKRFKFERAKAAALPLALALNDLLPHMDDQTLVVSLPTAYTRVRQRGYDQAALLGKCVARLRGLQMATPLLRQGQSRQVGATRAQRQAQSKNMFSIKNPHLVKGRSILLIDDICTTGASLSAAAKLLRRAGAHQVSAAVVAWQKPDS